MSLDAVQQIKDRVDIVELIGSYVRLTKAGRSYKGLSPFKKEKTPSFYVSPDKGMYYCFSTNKGGDIFTFVEEMERVDFQGALRLLAERAGITLTNELKEDKNSRERLFAILERAANLYAKELATNTEALEYIQKRGCTPDTIKTWGIGYAPEPKKKGWTFIFDALCKEGFEPHEIERVGLIKRKDDTATGTPYDRFRSRIMFPLKDVSGRVVGFSGRLFPDDKSGLSPKYLNSPETPLYHKSSLLYGIDKAKQAMRKHDFAILVEGQMDLVLSHQSGYATTVAVSGTGLTNEHMDIVSRMTKKVVLAFDADSAGIASTHKAGILALKRGMEVKVAVLPMGVDPADMIRENAEDWKSAIREALPLITVAMQNAKVGAKNEQALVRNLREQVLPLIAAMPNSMDRSLLAREVSEFARLHNDTVYEEVEKIRQQKSFGDQDIDVVRGVELESGAQIMTRRAGLERVVAGFMIRAQVDKEVQYDSLTADVALALRGTSVQELLSRYSDDRALPFEIEMMLEGSMHKVALVKDAVYDLRLVTIKDTFFDVSKALRLAEEEGDQEKQVTLLSTLHQLTKELTELQAVTRK